MRVRSVNIDMQALGAEFAGMDSSEQANFFKGLARELALWNSSHNIQVQFCFVSDDLNHKEKEELKNALEMLWYKEDRR